MSDHRMTPALFARIEALGFVAGSENPVGWVVAEAERLRIRVAEKDRLIESDAHADTRVRRAVAQELGIDDPEDSPPCWDEIVDVARAARTRVAELEATLANDRGKGEPPGEGWEWVASPVTPHGWRTESSSALPYHPKPRQPYRLWAWTYMPPVGECITGTELTARAAMRAADIARGEHRGGEGA